MTRSRNTPPGDAVAEAALLGAMMLGDGIGIDVVADVRELVAPGDLIAPRHQHIFRAIVAVRDRGDQVDELLVAAELDRAGLLESVDGAEYLSTLTSTTPAVSNAAAYAGIVADHAHRRRLIHAAADLNDAASSGDPAAIARALNTVAASHDRDASDREPRLIHLSLVRLADVVAEPVSWLWPGYVPLGKLTMLDGLPDLGKSTIALDISARVTNGAPMPDGSRSDVGGPADVVLLTAEDGLADTVRPRVDAAGGDAKRVQVVTATIVTTGTGQTERWPNLRDDLAALTAVILERSVRLVVVDVLMAYLPGEVNTYRDQDVRSVLSPLARIAEDTGCAVVLLRHPTKAGSANPVLVGGGSIGIVGSARVGLLAGYDPDDEEPDLNRRRRLLAVAKCNIAAKSPTMAYTLELAPGDLAAHVRWDGTTDHRAEDLSAPPQRANDDDGDRHGNEDQHARVVVAELLADGPMLVADISEYLNENGVHKRTALRHLQRLGGATAKLGGNIAGGPQRGWAWTLDPPLTDAQRAALIAEEDRRHAPKPTRKRTPFPQDATFEICPLEGMVSPSVVGDEL
jgi:hypothetical protein